MASLVFEDCAGFTALARDAAAPERAYADYLAGRAEAKDAALLPEQHRAVAVAAMSASDLKGVADPLARLVAAGVLMQTNGADPATIAVAIDTASAQGWRRPLLAWLGVQAQRADAARPSGRVMRWRWHEFRGGLRWRVRARRSCLEWSATITLAGGQDS